MTVTNAKQTLSIRRPLPLGALAAGLAAGLYAAGAVTSYVVPSDEGPHRKYYGINAQGRAMLAAQRKDWTGFADAMGRLLGTERVA